MHIILCEKPSVAKAFATTLKATPLNGIYKNDKYIILNCVGHLFELYMPEDYSASFKKWQIETLPIIPEQFKYKKIKNVEKQAQLVLEILKSHKTDKIIIATDAGREGELIARLVLQQAGFTSIDNIYRFWASAALTDEVILSGLKAVKHLSEYNKLSLQGYARQHADWLVGINCSRLLSILSNSFLPVGRVQTAILYELYKRELEIKNFIPTPYFEYAAELASSEANLNSHIICKKYILKDNKINTKFAEKINLQSCIDKKAILENKEIITKKEKAEKLFNITALQKQAFKCFNLSPEQTLLIAQKLYEEYKCLSYPRTPSRVMSISDVEFTKTIYNRFKKLRPQYITNIDENLFNADNSHVYNDEKLEDHHALIPLAEIPVIASASEKNVFELVVKQFFIVFSKPYIYERISLFFIIDSHKFIATGNKTLQIGWKQLASSEPNLNNDTEEEQNNFNSINLNNLICKTVQCNKKLTQPKPFYRFDTLLSFMENPKLENEEKKLVGLGTPATRSEIIKNLLTRNYIEEYKKNLRIKEKAVFLITQIKKYKILWPLIDTAQTTNWEEQMENNPIEFLQNIKKIIMTVCKAKLEIEKFRVEKEGVGRCPICKKNVLESKNNYYCSGYKEGCSFSIGKEILNATISKNDLKNMLEGKYSSMKKCKNKQGKEFKCKFSFDENYKIKFIFNKEVN